MVRTSYRVATTVVVIALVTVASIMKAAIAEAIEPPGQYEGEIGGARYVISVPAQWNGGLVMFAHGYQGEGPGAGNVALEPLDRDLASAGYAWAASGYRSFGYRPDWFLSDLLTLRASFIQRFGKPRWTIIHGQSMGGHVSIASLELHPEVYQGALIECGVIDGVGLVDWLAAYKAAAAYFSGLPLLEVEQDEFDRLVNLQLPRLLGTPGQYTERGRQFDSVVKHLSGGDLPLRLEGMSQRYLLNLHARDPGPSFAQEFARHADTRQMRYDIDPGFGLDAAALNREIPRIAPEPEATANPVFAELSGKISVPVMALHETADFRVPFWLQQDYRRRTIKAGTSHRLVQRAVRATGHCGFSREELKPAFDSLVGWIEHGTVPEGDDVLGDPSRLGLRWTKTWDPRDPAGSKR